MNGFVYIFLLSLVSGAISRPQSEDIDYSDYEYDGPDDVQGETGEDVPVGKVPVFAEQSKKFTVKEGESVTLSCKTTEPVNRVLLFSKYSSSGNRILFTDDIGIFDSKFTADQRVYFLQAATRNDAGKYFCKYQQQGGDVVITYEVDVQYAPSVEPMKPSVTKVLKGNRVSFDCKADGNPEPTIKWSREDQMLPTGAKEEGRSLMFEDADRHVEGTYVCTADNGIGDAAFASKKLLVEYEPEIITEKEIIRTGDGDKVELVCVVHARPKANVEWTKEGGDPISPEEDVQEIDGSHRHSIMIAGVTEADFGSYKCSATNNLGAASAMINLTDIPRRPQFTSDPTGAEDTQYTLTWETESFYPITQYLLKYRSSKANITERWTDETFEVAQDKIETDELLHTMKHTITDLMPATDYDVIVSVKNQHKWGDTSTFKFSTRKARPTTTTPQPSPEESENASHITAGANLVTTLSLAVILCSLAAHFIS